MLEDKGLPHLGPTQDNFEHHLIFRLIWGFCWDCVAFFFHFPVLYHSCLFPSETTYMLNFTSDYFLGNPMHYASSAPLESSLPFYLIFLPNVGIIIEVSLLNYPKWHAVFSVVLPIVSAQSTCYGLALSQKCIAFLFHKSSYLENLHFIWESIRFWTIC